MPKITDSSLRLALASDNEKSFLPRVKRPDRCKFSTLVMQEYGTMLETDVAENNNFPYSYHEVHCNF